MAELEPKLNKKMQAILENSQVYEPRLVASDELKALNESTDVDEKYLTDEYDDIVRCKYQIMQMLTENDDLITALHNEDLKDYGSNHAYKYVNIFDFLKMPGTQSTVKNFVCFEVNDVEQPRYSDGKTIRYIVFRTVSHEDDVRTDYGVARQDLLAAIIKNDFDWTQNLGMHLEKIHDYGKVTENGYYYREFTYQTTVANNLVNKAKMINGLKSYKVEG